MGALSRSIWAGDVFSAFLFLVSGNSTHVGIVMGVRGISQLVLAPLFGWMADVGRRESALRIGALLGVIGALATSVAAHSRSDLGMCVSQAIWGAHWAAANPSADALFADSIMPGDRSWWFTAKYQLIQLAGIAGPAISMAVFLLHANDTWQLGTCVLVLDIGAAIAIVPNVLLVLLKDVRKLRPPGRDGEPLRASLLEQQRNVAVLGPAAAVAPAPADANGTAAEAKAPTASAAAAAVAAAATTCCCGRLLVVPVLVLAYDVISALAAGLVIRFFPIFFLRDLALSPCAVSALSIGAMATIAACGSAAQALAQRVGRVPVAFGFRLAGIGSFMLMAALASVSAVGMRPWVLAAYLLRMGLVNSTFGLTKSIIHDVVPPSQRARYASIDSINQATWAGSAAIGGVIIDKYGMIANFYLTACAQLLALVPIWVARQLVPDERHAHAQAAAANKL